MSKNNPWMVFAGCVLLALLLWMLRPAPEIVPPEITESLRRLEVSNDSLAACNLALTVARQRLQRRADSLQAVMARQKEQINTFKHRHHEKIRALDAVAHDELLHFFATFYADSTGQR